MGWEWRPGRLCLVWATFPSFCRLAFLMGDDRGPPGSEVSTAGQHGLFLSVVEEEVWGFPIHVGGLRLPCWVATRPVKSCRVWPLLPLFYRIGGSGSRERLSKATDLS